MYRITHFVFQNITLNSHISQACWITPYEQILNTVGPHTHTHTHTHFHNPPRSRPESWLECVVAVETETGLFTLLSAKQNVNKCTWITWTVKWSRNTVEGLLVQMLVLSCPCQPMCVTPTQPEESQTSRWSETLSGLPRVNYKMNSQRFQYFCPFFKSYDWR